MTKDRYSEMRVIMQENCREPMNKENREPVPEEMSESITSFLSQVQCCREEIQSIKDQIDTLKRYHNKIQRCTDESRRKELDENIEELKVTITSSLTAIRNNVKSIEDLFMYQKISPALKRMKQVQTNSLVISLNEIIEEYYDCLMDHSKKCKKLLYDMMNIVDGDKVEMEELIQMGKIAFFTNNLLLNELEQKTNFRNVEDRHADILKVEKSIIELRNLTQDLSLVVGIQVEKVNCVQDYVEQTKKKVEDAARIMKSASKLRNKSRKRKLIISLVCLGFIVIVATIMVWI